MADVQGMRGTGNITQALRKTDFHREILELEPDAAPLTVLSGRIGSEPTVNPEYKWAESQLESRFDQINNGAGYTNVATSLVVDTGTKFHVNELWKVTRTGEVFRVTAVATNTLTVVRGIGTGGTGVAILDNDDLLKVAIAKQEGDDVDSAVSVNPSVVTNYCQIFRRTYSTTETNRIAATFTSPADFDYAGKHAAIEFKKDCELAYWHGKPSEDTTGTHPRRTTGGVFNYVVTNITSVGGAMTETVFFGGLRGPFRYGKKQKTLFCSQLFADVINTYPRSKIQEIQADAETTYGLNVMRFVSPQGTLNVVIHYLLEAGPSQPEFGGYGVLLDLSQVRARHLMTERGSRDTHIIENRQGPGIDGRTDEILGEKGLVFGLEKCHGIYKGVTG